MSMCLKLPMLFPTALHQATFHPWMLRLQCQSTEARSFTLQSANLWTAEEGFSATVLLPRVDSAKVTLTPLLPANKASNEP
jgi:hypothetical protein